MLAGCASTPTTQASPARPEVRASSTVSPAGIATPLAVSATGSPSAKPAATYSLDPESLRELPAGVTRVADQKGRPGQAFAFSGQMSKIEVPWDINPEKSPRITITAWARFTGNPEEQGLYQVISHDNGDYDRSLGIDTRAGSWGWSAFAGDAFVIGGVPVTPNEWTFLSASYDQTAKTAQMTAGGTVVPAKTSVLGKGHPHLWIGGNPSFAEHFIGEIAHVQIFDRILTPEELRLVENQ